MNEKYKEKAETLKYLQMDIRTMEFNEHTFDAILDKAAFDSVLVICGDNLVRVELDCQRRQDGLRDLSGPQAERSLHHRLLRATRIQTKLSGEARVRVDSKGATNPQAHDHVLRFHRLRGQGVPQCPLYLRLQEGKCLMVCQFVNKFILPHSSFISYYIF